jgi:hypothetical protein
MATVLGEKNGERTATYEVDREIAGLGTRKTWSTSYYVLGDTNEEEEDIVDAGGLPILYEVYNNGFCIEKSVSEQTEVEGGYLWLVDCSFDSHIEADIPVVDTQWDVEEKEMVIKYDAITGVPILNSAKELITTTAPVTIPILSITRIENDFTPSRILQYNNHVNQYVFFGAPPRCALMQGPRATKKIVKGVRKWEVVYRVKFNFVINPTDLQPAGWGLFLLDHGTRYIKGLDGDDNPVYASFKTDEEKSETTGNLNGLGYPLPAGAPEVYLDYNRYAIANFNLLNLE